MSWFSNFLGSSIGRKLLMSLSGLFLCSFLVIHMAGNFQLLKSDGGQAFNEYAYFMTHNPLIKTVSYLLYFTILLHAIDGLGLAYRNRAARTQKYAISAQKGSSWASRNMAILGSIILVFLIIHMKSFWFAYKFGDIPNDQWGHRDLYSVVVAAFSQWWYVLLYIIALIALAYHLLHGFQSAFQTLGINHKKYTPIIHTVGWVFTIIISLGFAAQPLFIFLKTQGII